MAKLTFSLDEPTVRALETTAERLGKPKSLVVREAIADYAARAGRLTELERRRMLEAFDALVATIPAETRRPARAEIRKVREERRASGRRRR
jgi:predicted transcriptional regulator